MIQGLYTEITKLVKVIAQRLANRSFFTIGYNESGRRIDITYLQGSLARIHLGTNAVVPGFEEEIRDMRPEGKRRITIPPEPGPSVGPSTFSNAKQLEVFDIELLGIQRP